MPVAGTVQQALGASPPPGSVVEDLARWVGSSTGAGISFGLNVVAVALEAIPEPGMRLAGVRGNAEIVARTARVVV